MNKCRNKKTQKITDSIDLHLRYFLEKIYTEIPSILLTSFQLFSRLFRGISFCFRLVNVIQTKSKIAENV